MVNLYRHQFLKIKSLCFRTNNPWSQRLSKSFKLCRVVQVSTPQLWAFPAKSPHVLVVLNIMWLNAKLRWLEPKSISWELHIAPLMSQPAIRVLLICYVQIMPSKHLGLKLMVDFDLTRRAEDHMKRRVENVQPMQDELLWSYLPEVILSYTLTCVWGLGPQGGVGWCTHNDAQYLSSPTCRFMWWNWQ